VKDPSNPLELAVILAHEGAVRIWTQQLRTGVGKRRAEARPLLEGLLAANVRDPRREHVIVGDWTSISAVAQASRRLVDDGGAAGFAALALRSYWRAKRIAGAGGRSEEARNARHELTRCTIGVAAAATARRATDADRIGYTLVAVADWGAEPREPDELWAAWEAAALL
jgi:hypothetical protein